MTSVPYGGVPPARIAEPGRFPRRERSSGLEVPDLLDEEPRFPVELRFGGGIKDVIAGEIMERNGSVSLGGMEVGGYLLGRLEFRHAYAATVTRMRWGAELDPTSVELDASAIAPLQRDLARDGIKTDLLGDYHCHPGGSGEPSERDLAAWLHTRDMYRTWRYVGVIVTPDRLWGWQEPAFNVWCVRREDRFPVCEPGVFVG